MPIYQVNKNTNVIVMLNRLLASFMLRINPLLLNKNLCSLLLCTYLYNLYCHNIKSRVREETVDQRPAMVIMQDLHRSGEIITG